MEHEDLLGRCDSAMCAVAQRAHTWPWLRDDAGELLAVDAFWPEARVALVLVALPPPAEWVAAAVTASGRGIDLIGLPAAALGDGDPRLLRMLLVWDSRSSMSALSEHGAGYWGQLGSGEPGTYVVFGTNVMASSDFHDVWEDDEDEDWADAGEDEDEDAPDETPRVELGWRTRPLALAALGAVALVQRAFAPSLTEPLDTPAMQLLVAVAVSESGPDVAEPDELAGLAARLGIYQSDARYAERELIRAGLVIAPPAYPDGTVELPILTDAGREHVERWLARVLPQFAGWPPEHLGVDDATG